MLLNVLFIVVTAFRVCVCMCACVFGKVKKITNVIYALPEIEKFIDISFSLPIYR